MSESAASLDAFPDADPPPPKPAESPEIAQVRADFARAEKSLAEGRLNEADGIALDILARHPGQPHAVALRAFVAARREEFDRAIFLLEAATARHHEPGWLALLANMYRRRFRLDDALRAGQLAVARASGAARLEPLLELARVHIDRGEGNEAAESFLAVLAIDPEHPGAHLGLGQVLLARGDFAPGWIEYEWRNRLPEAQGRIPPIKGAMWNGMALPRGRLLVVCDQGYGDGIQFARFLTEAASRVRELVLACSPELEGLFGRIPGVARCYHAWGEVPGFSAHILISSLPGVLELRADTIPAPVPYLTPDPDRVAHWTGRLAALGGAGLGGAALGGAAPRRIGLFWSGRKTHPNNLRRSLDLSSLGPVLDATCRDCVVSIQKERTEAEAQTLKEAGVHDLADELPNFDETAAIVANLDLLISVDSAVAHLAGALGRPVSVLVPTPADWRWRREGAETPWYPSMRLFRQPAPGDWTTAIADLAASLA